MIRIPVPHPEPDKYTQPYWDGLKVGRLLLPRCRNCGHVQMPMGPCCAECLAEDFAWEAMSGRGTVWAYVVYHHAFHPAFADRLPYNVALVELVEGPRLLSNVVGIAADAVRTGMQLQAVFEPEGDATLLCFRPAGASEEKP